MKHMFGWGRTFTYTQISHVLTKALVRVGVFVCCLHIFTFSAQATLKTADSISENYAPKLNLHWACSADKAVLSNGNTSGGDGYCPFGNQTDYAITFEFKSMSETDYMDQISLWPNSGGVYNDLELKTFDLQVFYINESTDALQSLTMKDVTLGDTQSANDPQIVFFTDALGTLLQLKQVSSITLSNWRNNKGSTGETPVREVQFNIFSPPAGALSATKTVSMKNTDEYAIPGSDIIYTLDVYNKGGTYISKNSIFLVDTLPDDFEFYNGDFDGKGQATNAVLYNQSNAGLSFDYNVDYAFSNTKAKPTDLNDCNYVPDKGYDANIKHVW